MIHKILKSVSPVVLLLIAVAGVQAQTVLKDFNYPNGVNAVAVDFLAGKAYALLPNYNADGSNAVQVLDTKSNVVVNTFATGGLVNAIGVNVLSGTVYIGGAVASATNPSGIESEVLALNPKTGAILATIPITPSGGSGIVALTVDPLSNRIYVSNASDNAIAIINGRTNTVISTVALNAVPAGLAANFLISKVYVALNNNQIAILSERTGAVSYVNYGSQTTGVAVDPFLCHEYVTDAVFDVPTVGVLNRRGATLASLPVGLFPQGVDVDMVNHNVFIANEGDGTITEINGETKTVVATIPVAANSIVVDPVQHTVYAVGSNDVTVVGVAN